LTNFEKNQHPAVFISAGKKSFLMAVHIQNNPYTLKPFRSLWEKGYRAAKRMAESGRAPSPFDVIPVAHNRQGLRSRTERTERTARVPWSKNPNYKGRDKGGDKNRAVATRPFKAASSASAPVSNAVSKKAPAINLSRIEKFNNKYRTQV
jgi:hypothetical protein